MSRILEVWGEEEFRIEIPDDAKVTFGPWSPSSAKGSGTWSPGAGHGRGTLRVYKGARSTENILAVFSGVEGFRDTSAISMSTPIKPSTPITQLGWSHLKKAEKEELVEMLVKRAVAVSKEDEDGDGIEVLPF